MRLLPAALLTVLTLSFSFQLLGQQSIVKKCESTKLAPGADETQPIPDQLKLPGAPETARDVGCFSSLPKNSTMIDVVRKCGIPDKHLGSGIYIFVYYMKDCLIVSASTPDLQRLVMKHVKRGKAAVLLSNW